MYAAMRGPNGRVDGLLTGQATTLAYLLDWTLKDDMSGEPLIIRGKSRQEIIAILDSLDPEDVKEIDELVDKWDDRMIAERKEEKKILNTKVSYESSSSSANDSGSATEKSTS